jgi:alkaline ceramidase
LGFQISNAPFFFVPPVLIYLFGSYGVNVTRGVNIIWIFLIVVGAGSVFFHSTLTLAGQLMDELAILWVLMLSYAILFPDKYIPNFFLRNR